MLFACQTRQCVVSVAFTSNESASGKPLLLIREVIIMTMQTGLNTVAAFLSFGFVIAIVLGVV